MDDGKYRFNAIRIHPYTMFDMLMDPLIKFSEIEHDGKALRINKVWYIEDTRIPYTGSNPEFLKELSK